MGKKELDLIDKKILRINIYTKDWLLLLAGEDQAGNLHIFSRVLKGVSAEVHSYILVTYGAYQ